MEITAFHISADRASPPPEANSPPDGTTFAHVYAELWPWAVRVAALITQDPDAGQEIAQDSFLALFQHWDDGIDNPRAYLRSTLVNRCRNWRRGRLTRRRKLPLLAGPEASELGASELADAIAALPLRQRTVIVLRYYEDLSEREIAEALGCRPGTVKSLSSRALRSLRKEMSR